MYINGKGGLQANMSASILRVGCQEVLPLGSCQCSKKIGDGPMNMTLLTIKKEEVMSAPMNYS
jgi:hypothetical protein